MKLFFDLITALNKYNAKRLLKGAITITFFGVMLTSCSYDYRTEFRNYDSTLPLHKTASITGYGIQLHLIGAKKKLVDRLRLEPGDYMIGFKQVSSRLSGVARCKVKKGKQYKVKIVGRKLLKGSHTTALLGVCQKIISP